MYQIINPMSNFGVVPSLNPADPILKYGVFRISVKITSAVLLLVDLNVDYGDMGMMIIKEHSAGIFLSRRHFASITI